MLHYHGTPITPRSALHELAGRHFCVSFARLDDLNVCLAIGQSIMFDNGAFSAWTRGHAPDWEGYYRWLEPLLRPPHWAIIPDVIDGTVEENIDLVERCPLPLSMAAPVWHLHEPLDYLRWLQDRHDRVCFGSSGEYAKVGTNRWCSRVSEGFGAVKPWTWVHMLRGMDAAIRGPWPFASADSTNVAQNHKRDGLQKAARIDAMQPKAASRFPTQHELGLPREQMEGV